MALICPTILALEPHEYREQFDRVQSFAERLQIDLADGDFAPNKTVGLNQIWWDDSDKIDIHLMYRKPEEHLLDLIRLSPHMVIVHAEADGNFIEIARELHEHGIRAGVALLKSTKPEVIQPAIDHIDHVLIFSGDLGHFGGNADLALLDKVKTIKSWRADIEIGWDGGANADNAKQLAAGGVDVINVGGFIQKAEEPQAAYDKLQAVIKNRDG